MTEEATGAIPQLLRRARGLLEGPPDSSSAWSARVDAVAGIARSIDEEGVDGTSLIRLGMSELFLAPVLGTVTAALLLAGRRPSPVTLDGPIDVDGWCAALGLSLDAAGVSGDPVGLVAHVAGMVEGWLVFAPFGDLVRLQPPRQDELADWSSRVDDAMREARNYFRWLVDRTLHAEVFEWSLPSLEKEYRARFMGGNGGVPESFRDVAEVDEGRLAHCLIRKLLDKREDERESELGILLQAVQEQATSLLAAGHYEQAAALFEFFIIRCPSDPALRNNLAFCLIPLRPVEAYDCLRDAGRMGYNNRSLLLYNRTCCATSEATMRDLLIEANHHWLSDLEGVPQPATIWAQGESGLRLRHTIDVRADLAVATKRIAEFLGERGLVELWQERVDNARIERPRPS